MPHTDAAISKATRPSTDAASIMRLMNKIADDRIVKLYHQLIEKLTTETCSARRFSHVCNPAEACATCSNTKSCTTQPGRIACGPCLASQRICSRVEAATKDILHHEYGYDPWRVSRALRRKQHTPSSSSSPRLSTSLYKVIDINSLDCESRIQTSSRPDIERESTPPPRGSVVPRSPLPSLPITTAMPSQCTATPSSTAIGQSSLSMSPPDTPAPLFPRRSGIIGHSTPAEQLAEENRRLKESLGQRDHVLIALREENKALRENVTALRTQLEGQEAFHEDTAYYQELVKENQVLRAERNERDGLTAKNEELEQQLEEHRAHLLVYAKLIALEHLHGVPSQNEFLEAATEISQHLQRTMPQSEISKELFRPKRQLKPALDNGPTADDFASLREIVKNLRLRSREAYRHNRTNPKKEMEMLKTAVRKLIVQVGEWLAKVDSGQN